MFTPGISFFSKVAVGVPTQSLSLDSGSSRYLSMTETNFGAFNSTKFAISLWYMRSTTGISRTLYSASTNYILIQFNSSDQLSFNTSTTGGVSSGRLLSTAAFSDTASWHNIYFNYDSSNATSNQRMRMWYDGTEITSFSTANYPTSGTTISPSGGEFDIGGNAGSAAYDGLIYQPAFFSGTLPAIGSIYNAGHPVNLIGQPGLYSLLNTNTADPLTKDSVLVTAWTNNNSVSKSSTIPT